MAQLSYYISGYREKYFVSFIYTPVWGQDDFSIFILKEVCCAYQGDSYLIKNTVKQYFNKF